MLREALLPPNKSLTHTHYLEERTHEYSTNNPDVMAQHMSMQRYCSTAWGNGKLRPLQAPCKVHDALVMAMPPYKWSVVMDERGSTTTIKFKLVCACPPTPLTLWWWC